VEVIALPILGIVKTDFPGEVGNDWRRKNGKGRACLQVILPAAITHAEWRAKILALFVRAIGVVVG